MGSRRTAQGRAGVTMAYNYSYEDLRTYTDPYNLSHGQFYAYLTSDNPEHIDQYSTPQFPKPVPMAAEAHVRVSPPRFHPSFTPEPSGQRKLFEYTPPKIAGLYADSRISSKGVATLLALALDRYPNAVPDNNLSEYSASIARKGIDMGLVQPNEDNPEAAQTFDNDAREFSKTAIDDDGYALGSTPYSDVELLRARNKVKSVLGRKREAPTTDDSPQFQQMQIPGI